MNWMFAAIGYDPEKEGRKPLVKKDDKKRIAPKQKKLPDNVKLNTTSMKLEKKTIEDDGSMNWEDTQLEDDFGYRAKTLNDQEINFLESTKNMLVNKGEILKPLWADGMTAQEASDTFAERGFSYDTVRKYWTMFNKNTSPIENTDQLREGHR